MAQCKRCKKEGLDWYQLHNKWVLWEPETWQPHNDICPNINQPLESSNAKYYCKHGLKSRCAHGCI